MRLKGSVIGPALAAMMALGALALPRWLCAQPLSEGDVAPNWILRSQSGDMVSLYEQADSGNTTVMVFWATWCPMCKDLIPELTRLKEHFASQQVSFYFMNVWEDHDPEAFAIERKMDPIILHADNVAKRYQIGTTPGIIVVSPDRTIRYRVTPIRQTKAVISNLEQLLKDSRPQKPESNEQAKIETGEQLQVSELATDLPAELPAVSNSTVATVQVSPKLSQGSANADLQAHSKTTPSFATASNE